MGRPCRLDLRFSDGRCGDRVPNAQPGVALRVLRHKTGCLPRISSNQPDGQTPPGA